MLQIVDACSQTVQGLVVRWIEPLPPASSICATRGCYTLLTRFGQGPLCDRCRERLESGPVASPHGEAVTSTAGWVPPSVLKRLSSTRGKGPPATFEAEK